MTDIDCYAKYATKSICKMRKNICKKRTICKKENAKLEYAMFQYFEYFSDNMQKMQK